MLSGKQDFSLPSFADANSLIILRIKRNTQLKGRKLELEAGADWHEGIKCFELRAEWIGQLPRSGIATQRKIKP